MINILIIILLFLLLFVGKIRGLKAFICLFLNYFLVILYIFFIGLGFNAVILAIITCVLASIIILFILNGLNIKTISSFISVSFVLVITFFVIFFTSKYASINGFTYDSLETIGSYSFDINYNMTLVIIGMYLICTIGTIIDTSISVSSALNEVKINNPRLNEKELFNSGMNIGKDILSTTINTLYFVVLGSFIGFFFFHESASFSYIINYKAFAIEVIELLLCFISSILIIPITSFVSAKLLNKNTNY